MAATFDLSIITPENEFFSGQADMLVLPCEDGEVGIMANHAPMIASIPPGELRLCVDGQWRLVSVSDGFATVTPERVLVLVQTAERPEDIDINRAERDRRRAMEILRQQKSMREYASAKALMARAMVRLKVSKHNHINQ